VTPPPGIAAPRRVSLQRFEPRPALRADHLIETDSSDFCGLQSGVSWTRPTCQINQFPSGKEVRRADTVRVARPQTAALAAVMIYLGALRPRRCDSSRIFTVSRRMLRARSASVLRDSNKTSFQANYQGVGPVRGSGGSDVLRTAHSKAPSMRCYQKLNFSANWTIRGLELKLRTLPKSAVLMSLTGLSLFG